MKLEKVVSNSSPLMNLAIIGELDILRKLFGVVIVPQEVWDELTIEGKDKLGTDDILQADWICFESVVNRSLFVSLNIELDIGESAAIALAVEQKADLILLDETEARNVAEFYGLRKTGVIGLLIRAKQNQLISQIRPLMEALQNEAHFWIKPDLYERILSEVGE